MMNQEKNYIQIHFPFSPWKCGHGWDEEKEGKSCPACDGFCLSCNSDNFPLDEETGNCLICQDVFDSDYEFYKESNEPHEYPGPLGE
jgi:hypothetical protein